MKKILGLTMCLLIVVVLGGCAKKEYSADTTIDQDSGIYDYISGDASGSLKQVKLTSENGEEFQAQVEGTKFQAHAPAMLHDQEVELKLTFDDGHELTKNVELKKRNAIDEYESFAAKMNPLISGSNENAKTQFPSTEEDGIHVISSENGVQTNANIQDGKLLGISIVDKGEDIHKETPTILVCFQIEYSPNNKGSDGVTKAYNNILESKKKTSFTTHGYKFTFEYNKDKLFADIIKSE